MTNSDGILFLNIREEGTLVVDLEVKNTVLVGQSENASVGRLCAVRSGQHGREPVEWGEHAKFELQSVGARSDEGAPFVPGVFGQRDRISLYD